MSSNNKLAFAASAAITCTLTSLANGSARQSASVDNSSNLYLDYLITAICSIITGTIASDKAVNIYAAGSEDGMVWPGEGSGNNDGVTGSDAAITLESPTNLRLIGSISVPTSLKVYTSQPISVAAAFAGILPRKFSIIIENRTGLAFASSGNGLQGSGVYSTNSA